MQSALNITDNSIHVGFWFTVKDVEGCHSQMMSALKGKGARGLPKMLYGRLRGLLTKYRHGEGKSQNVVDIICESPQVSLGVIGDRLVDPILVWNDTLRDGPRDVQGRAAGDSQVKIVSYIKDLQSQSPINHTIQS